MEKNRYYDGGNTVKIGDIEIRTVPKQRVINVNKSPTDKTHLYTANNLAAIDEAANRLQSLGGFKLYIYLAKNQDKYTFALSSKAFCEWSSLGIQAYNTAFAELVNEGYLVESKTNKNYYAFYDKSQEKERKEKKDISNPNIVYPTSAPTDDFIY